MTDDVTPVPTAWLEGLYKILDTATSRRDGIELLQAAAIRNQLGAILDKRKDEKKLLTAFLKWVDENNNYPLSEEELIQQFLLSQEGSNPAANPDPAPELPHSRACGIRPHDHGRACHSNCPTCGGRPFTL